MHAVTLRAAAANDIPFIMACERRPDYEPLVGRWTADQHRETMGNPEFRYLVGLDDAGKPQGFTILRLNFPGFPNCYLKRVAVHDAGGGFGMPFLAAVTGWIFTNTETHRLWLEVVDTNTRAIHVYRTLGFTEEGRAREAFVHGDGSRGSYVQMSLLKPEWQARG